MKSRFQLWLEKTNETRKQYWESHFSHREYTPLTYKKGGKWMKIIDEGSVWAFIALADGEFKGTLVKEGDFMKPASWASPAKHSRGNIFEGTDRWEYYGPTYLK
jgi:hypothetical protein